MTFDASRTLAFLRRYWQTFAAGAFAGVFLAVVGAFGTDKLPLATRLVYWVPMLLVGTFAGTLIALRTMRRPRIGENAVAVWAIVTLLVTVPGTLLVWAYTRLIFGTLSSLPLLFLEVALVSGAASAIMMLINRPGPATRAAAPSGSATAPPRFLDRLPEKLKGAAIFALQAEDHYLRIHTSKGSDLILMRLTDAIVELEGIEGAQTHRSWWVAKDAVTDIKRDDRRVTLTLKDGVEAPVSRPNVKALRDAGWI